MRTPLLLLSLLAFAGLRPLGAQDYTPPNADGTPASPPAPDSGDGASGGVLSPPADGAEPADKGGSVDDGTARDNYQSIVEAYINNNSPNGYMPFRDKKGRLWKLELEGVDIKTFRPVKEGVFTACTKMRSGSDKLDLDFLVLFAGDNWKVTGVKLHKVNGKKPDAAKRRRKKAP